MHNNSLFGNPFGGLPNLGPTLGSEETCNAFRANNNAEIKAFRMRQMARQAACQEPEQSDFDNGEVIDVEGLEVIPGEKRIGR